MMVAKKKNKKIDWRYVLGLVTILGIILNVIIFYPGYMSNDSVAYLLQAKGLIPLDSLHPIFMALFWGLLIKMTGYVSAMLAVQVILLWASCLLISLYIYKQSRSKYVSMAVALMPLLPYVFNISGVMWSDVVYAGLMLFSVALALWLKDIRDKRWRVALLILTLGVLMMAITVRYNTIPAVFPVIVLALYRSRLFTRKIVVTGTAVVIVIAAVGALIGVSQLLYIKDEKLVNGPQLDDIVNIAPRSLIETHTGEGAQQYLLGVYDCSAERNIKLDVIHNCGAKGNEAFELAAPHTESIGVVWKKAILNDPMQYMQHKIANYVSFLFPAYQSKYIWHEGIDTNTLGIEVKNPRLGTITSTIIHNFFYKYFSFLYEPWFWLAVSVVLGYRAFRSKDRELKYIILALCTSSALVILSYVPTGATIDYRYVYWPAIAMTTAILLVCVKLKPLGHRLTVAIKKYSTF